MLKDKRQNEFCSGTLSIKSLLVPDDEMDVSKDLIDKRRFGKGLKSVLPPAFEQFLNQDNKRESTRVFSEMDTHANSSRSQKDLGEGGGENSAGVSAW